MDKKGLILSIIGLCLFWVPVAGLVLCIIGLVKSVKALKEAKITNGPKGKAITGIALGGSGIGASFIFFFYLIIAIGILVSNKSILDKAMEATENQKSIYDSYDEYDYDYYDYDWDL